MNNIDVSDGDGVPRTFRTGPSDPVAFADGPGTWVETRIAAPVERVWEAVTDIDLPARFSDEFQGATWKSDGAAERAVFVGRNRHPAIGEWETESTVVEFEPDRVFAWAVSDPDDPGATWRFRLEPEGDETVLRYEMSLGPGPSGITVVIASMPEREAPIIHRRIGEHHTNMSRTVEGIRRDVEGR